MPIIYDTIDIDFLTQDALTNGLNKSRLCLHQSDDSLLQYMLIAHTYEYKVPVHSHIKKSEVIEIQSGDIEIIFYDRVAIRPLTHVIMNSLNGVRTCFIEKGIPHRVVIKSNVAIFSESTTGPFLSDDLIVFST